MSIDVSRLSPQDAVAALRSYPRRYASLLEPVADDDNVEAMARRPGPDGLSALDIVASAARSLGTVREALRVVEVDDRPALAFPVDQLDRPAAGASGAAGIGEVLAAFRNESTALADAVTHVDAGDWQRTGTDSTGHQITALELVREAVRVGADNLPRTDTALAAARS